MIAIAIIIMMPWWVSLLFLSAAIFYFPKYYEAVFAAFLMDVLYAAPEPKFFGFLFVSTAAAILILILAEYAKKNFFRRKHNT